MRFIPDKFDSRLLVDAWMNEIISPFENQMENLLVWTVEILFFGF
jgi:hypothetical protein